LQCGHSRGEDDELDGGVYIVANRPVVNIVIRWYTEPWIYFHGCTYLADILRPSACCELSQPPSSVAGFRIICRETPAMDISGFLE
jgi:hypothetical protein